MTKPKNPLGKWKWLLIGWIAGLLLMMALSPVLAYGETNITSEPDTDGVAGEMWSYTVETDTGYDDDGVEWALVSGPGWMSLDGHTLSGTPTTDGNYVVNVSASFGGSTDYQEFTVVITPAGDNTWIFFILILFMISAVASWSRADGFQPRIFLGCFSINIVVGVFLGMLEMWMVLPAILMTAILIFIAIKGGSE